MPPEPQKNGAPHWGRSRGGFSRQLPLACDGLGQPVRFILSAGQRHDLTEADALRVGFAVTRVIADKGYAADALIAAIQESGAEVVIPSKANRKEPRLCWHNKLNYSWYVC